MRRILEWVIELRHAHFFVWNVGFFVEHFHETNMQYQQQRGCIDLSKSRLATICPSSLKSKNVRNMCAFTNDVRGWFLGSWPCRRIVRNTRPNVQCQHNFFSQQNPFFVYPSFPASIFPLHLVQLITRILFCHNSSISKKHTFIACSTNSCGNCNLSTIVSAHGPCICGTYRLTTKWVKRVSHTLVIEINCMSWSSWCTLNILLHFTTGFFPSKNEIVLKKQTAIFKNKNKYTILFCFLFHYWLFLQHMKIENITEQQKTISKKHCNKKRYGKQKTKTYEKHTSKHIKTHIFFSRHFVFQCVSQVVFFCFVCNRSFVNPGPSFVLQKSTPLGFPTTDENDEKSQIV